jgi:hypothetical protein
MSTCEFCPAVFPGFQSRAAVEWSWFTGRLDRTVHFCPACRDDRAYQISAVHQLACKSTPDRARYKADLALAFAGATFRHAEEPAPWQMASYQPPEPDEQAIGRAAALAWRPGESRGDYQRSSFAAWSTDEP